MQLKPVIHLTGQREYPRPLPFHPPQRYPELDFLPPDTCAGNGVYSGVRTLLRGLGCDAARFGTPDWSPLSDLVQPGGRVVLKPNFVRHFNEIHGDSVEAVVTHLSVLRPLIDYAIKAVGMSGEVVIADAPQYDCEIDVLLEKIHLADFLDWYRDELDVEIEWRDLRVEFGRHLHGVQFEKRALPGDPEGYIANAPFVWGPQPFKGHIFFTDWNTGLWAVKLAERTGPGRIIGEPQ